MHFSYVEYNGDEDDEVTYLWHHRMFFCCLEFKLIIMNVGEVDYGGTMQKCLAGSVRTCDL